jgi:hypothetical protein
MLPIIDPEEPIVSFSWRLFLTDPFQGSRSKSTFLCGQEPQKQRTTKTPRHNERAFLGAFVSLWENHFLGLC